MDKECKGYDMNFKWVIRLPPLLHQTWVDYELYLAYDALNSIETWGGSGYFRSGRYVVTSQFANYIGLLIACLFGDIARIFFSDDYNFIASPSDVGCFDHWKALEKWSAYFFTYPFVRITINMQISLYHP